ncbi:unnamed protein product, partial [Ilex paraguariensis]
AEVVFRSDLSLEEREQIRTVLSNITYDNLEIKVSSAQLFITAPSTSFRSTTLWVSAGDSVTAGSPADLMMAAHEIARDHFDYESGDANIAALKYLLRNLKGEKPPF